MQLNVLVFPCGSEIGLELHRALGTAKEVVLYGASSISDHGEFVYENYIAPVPYVDNDQFITSINRIIIERHIDYVIPAHDAVILRLAEASQRGELVCKVLTSPYETCAVCSSKGQTYKRLSKVILMPHLYESLSDVDDWPVFLKPDIGCGSKGVVKACTRLEAEYHLLRSTDLSIWEYLPGREFTVDCFSNRHRSLIFCGGRERARISNGISVRTTPVNNSQFRDIAEKIHQSVIFHGMWFFQVKEDRHGRLAVMEIAPRIAGAMGLYRNCGVNFALMSLYEAEGCDVGIIQNDYPIVFDRALDSRFRIGLKYDHVYVDYDDCLVIRDKLNLQLLMFLYQCVNRGVGITLLSRHGGNLEAELRRRKIWELFDTVINVTDKLTKSSCIREQKAIFIDDSFAERCEVRAQLGIPVFAPDAVESLLS